MAVGPGLCFTADRHGCFTGMFYHLSEGFRGSLRGSHWSHRSQTCQTFHELMFNVLGLYSLCTIYGQEFVNTHRMSEPHYHQVATVVPLTVNCTESEFSCTYRRCCLYISCFINDNIIQSCITLIKLASGSVVIKGHWFTLHH